MHGFGCRVRLSATLRQKTPAGLVGICVLVASVALLGLVLNMPTRASEGLPIPHEEDRLVDTDGDGLADIYENWLGTDTFSVDTDMDGIPDGLEVAERLNPLVPSQRASATSAVRLDFIPEAGSIRFAITVYSSSAFTEAMRMNVLMGSDDQVNDVTRSFDKNGTTFRSNDGLVMGYVSDRMPLEKMPRRFSLAAVLQEESGLYLDDSLLGVRQGHFYRTEETPVDAQTVMGSTVFITPVVLTETEPGFSPNEDCKQMLGRVSGPIKVVLSENCVDQMDRYCPDDCGRDVGLRVICIRDLLITDSRVAVRTLVLGCGFLGRAVALALPSDDELVCVVRTPASAAALAADHFPRVLAIDAAQTGALDGFRGRFDETYVMLPPAIEDREGLLHAVRSAAAALEPAPDSRLIVISSTSVFGQDDGSVVTDDTTPASPNDSGALLLEAEEAALTAAAAIGVRVAVVRPAGLYGPGRLPGLSAVRRGAVLPGSPHTFFNLIQRDDLARLLLAIRGNETSRAVRMVASDGYPVRRGDYYCELASRLAAPPPRFRGGRELGKRVDPRHARETLLWRPRFPTYREGLEASLGGSGDLAG